MKWSSQVVLETDLSHRAANSFSVYMSVHAMLRDYVSVPVLLVCSTLWYAEYIFISSSSSYMFKSYHLAMIWSTLA